MCIRHMQYDPSSKSILSLPFQVCVKQNKQFLVPFCLSKYSWCMDFQCRVVVHLSRHYMFRENWLFSSEKLKFSLVPKQWVLLCAQLPWPWLYLVWLGPVYLFSWYCICCESICIAPLVCSEDLSFTFYIPSSAMISILEGLWNTFQGWTLIAIFSAF